MDTLYTFWDNITHYNTESVHFLGLMNSATRSRASGLGGMVWGLGSLISGLVSAEEGGLHTMGPD